MTTQLNELSLFAGIGGLSLGLKMADPNIRTVAYCEIDRYCQAVLLSRMSEGKLDNAPIWDDIRTLRGEFIKERIDIISGGFPCQDLSIAGKRAGIIEGNRSGLWFEYFRLICEIRPRFVFVENVSGLLMGGLGIVLANLAEAGYHARWLSIRASDVGANHHRNRIFLLADSTKFRGRGRSGCENGIQERELLPHESAGSEIRSQTSRCSCNLGNSPRQQSHECNHYIGCFTESGQPLSESRNPSGEIHVSDTQRAGFSPCADRPWQIESWRRNLRSEQWWASEPDVGGAIDGFARWMDRNINLLFNSHLRILAYVKQEGNHNAETAIKNRGEILSILQDSISKEKIRQRKDRRLSDISQEEILLSYLCKLQEASKTLDNLSPKSAEIQEEILRKLRLYKKPSRTSHRPESAEQSTGKHSNSLQTLSRFLAHDSEKAWSWYCRENAATDFHKFWELGIPRVAHGVAFRVDKLRALGNGVVPQQAAKAWEILSEGIVL